MSAVRLDSDTLGHLCVCAVRYALGRQSYISGVVAGIVVTYKRHLPGDDVEAILRDLAEARREDNLGMECDAKEWEILDHELRHMEKETR